MCHCSCGVSLEDVERKNFGSEVVENETEEEEKRDVCNENPSCPKIASDYGCGDPQGYVKGMCRCSCSSEGLDVKKRNSEIAENAIEKENVKKRNSEIAENEIEKEEVTLKREVCEEKSSCAAIVVNFGCEDPQGTVKGMCPCSCSSAQVLNVEKKSLLMTGNETEEKEKLRKRDVTTEQLFVRNPCTENPHCPTFVTNFGCDDARGVMKLVCPCTCTPQDDTENTHYNDDNTNDNSFGISTEEEIMLSEHNLRRRRHGVPDLSYDRKLARDSADWCDTLATSNTWAHSDQTNSVEGYGENLYYSYGMPLDRVPATAVKKWYDEINLYDFSSPGFSSPTGHFTQLVWRETTHVGCAVTDPGDNEEGKSYACCQYTPPGNWRGAFQENVPPPNY